LGKATSASKKPQESWRGFAADFALGVSGDLGNLKVPAARQKSPPNGCVAAKEHPMFSFFKILSAANSPVRSRSRQVRLAVEGFEERATPGGSYTSLGGDSYSTTTTQSSTSIQVTIFTPTDPCLPY
jgi:hypothetical protein